MSWLILRNAVAARFLPPPLKDAIDRALAHGLSRDEIFDAARRAAGKKQPGVVRAVADYLASVPVLPLESYLDRKE